MCSWNLVELFVGGLVLLILSLSLLLALNKEYLSLLQLKARLKDEKMKNVYYKQLIGSYEYIKEWKHDILNHVNIIDMLLKKGDYDEAQKYIEGISKGINENTLLISTDNKVLNAVLNLKIQLAKMNSVKIQLDLEIPSLKAFRSHDICSLFSNLLDNAIEAQLKTEDLSKRKVFLLVKTNYQKMDIICSNPIFQKCFIYNSKIKTSKKDIKKHGIGLKIVEKIVNKYNGIYQYSINEAFIIHIIIPLNLDPLYEERIYVYKYNEGIVLNNSIA